MAEGEKWLQCPQCFTLNPVDSRSCRKCGSSLGGLFETLTCGSPGQAGDDTGGPLASGAVFDRRYRIIEEIGRGGMGRVFKAEDIDLGITVALKIIRPRLSANPRFVDLFKKEMLLARSVSHESVIRIFDLGEAQGTKYISMEFIKGEDLKEFLRTSGTLAVETVVHMARQIGEALKAAHAKGIVHQDLKPSNIMVDLAGHIHVMDFGLAKAVYGAEAGKQGECAGTPQYMSPEQASGGSVGPASDIYSFGAVLYEMATGKPVFKAETPTEYRTKHVLERPVPPARINRHLPKSLARVILKCLEKSPAARYTSIDEVLADLDRVEGEQVQSPALAWLGRKWGYALAAALVMGYLLFRIIPRPGPPGPQGNPISLAVMWLTNNTGDKRLDRLRWTLPELMFADLLQSKYFRVTPMNRVYEILKSLRLVEAPAYSSQELKKVAAMAKADYILQGGFTKAGEAYRVSVVLYRARNLEPVKSMWEEGTETNLWSMAEGLNRKIKESLNFTAGAIAGDIHKDLKQITTGRNDALDLYMEGKRLYNEQKFEESVAALEKAVALDPEFAMAYRQLADDYSYLRDGERSRKNLNKARSLINRVSDREYYMIQASAASQESLREEVEVLKKLLSLYPADPDALNDLGAAYRNMEAWDLAAAQFERIPDGEKDELTYENLALVYSAEGDYQKAIDLLRSKLDAYSGYFGLHDRLSTAYLCLHQYDMALEEAGKARIADQTDFEPGELEGLIHLVRGDSVSAERCFRTMRDAVDPIFQLYGRIWLGHLWLAQGRYGELRAAIKAGLEHARTARFTPELRSSEIYAMEMLSTHERLRANDLAGASQAATRALEAAQEADRIDYLSLALHFRGVVLARRKSFDEAAVDAAKLRDILEKFGMSKELRQFHRVMGEIAREKGDLDGAIGSFETAVSLLPQESFKTDIHILYLDSLASAEFQKGDWDKAQTTYERLTALTTGRGRWGDLYARSYFWLGKIHQAKGEKDLAAGSYRRFLEIWAQADAGQPEVTEAREQLKALGVAPLP